MSERIKSWWRRNLPHLGPLPITRAEWDELDAAIREDERAKVSAAVHTPADQLTLGKLIARLEQLPKDALIEGLLDPHSYRGYYHQLAFCSGQRSVAMALDACRQALGDRFTGWKGGEYRMHRDTPVWSSECGDASGLMIVGISESAPYHILTVEEAW